jgi:hypothetical protein
MRSSSRLLALLPLLALALSAGCAAPVTDERGAATAAAATEEPSAAPALSASSRQQLLRTIQAKLTADERETFVTLQTYTDGTEADADFALAARYSEPAYYWWPAESIVVFEFAKPKAAPDDTRQQLRFYTEQGAFIARCFTAPGASALTGCTVDRT